MMLCRWQNLYIGLLLFTLAFPLSIKAQDKVDSLRSQLDNLETYDAQYLSTILELCGLVERSLDANQIPGLTSKGLETAKVLKDTLSLVKLYGFSGDFLWRTGMLTESAEKFNEIRLLAERSENRDWKALSFNGLGTVYYLMSEYDNAKKYYQLGIQSLLSDSTLLIRLYNNLANVYSITEQSDSVLYYYGLVLEYEQTHKDNSNTSITHGNLAIAYSQIGDQKKSDEHSKLAVVQAIESGDPYQNSVVYQTLAGLIYETQPRKAIMYYRKGLEYSQTAGVSESVIEFMENLAYMYDDIGNIDSAYYFIDMAFALTDSLENERKSKTISEIESSFEWAKEKIAEEHELSLAMVAKLKKELKQKVFSYVMWAVIIALAIILFILVHANLARARINRKLETSNITKDRFFSLIAHDLRSPLSGAIGLSEIIGDETEKLQGNRINYYAKSLNSTLNEVNSLVDNLLQWAQAETGRMSFVPENNNIQELVASTIVLLKDVFEIKDVEVKNQIPDNLILNCDKNMLSAIFRNILSNSSKFTESGGQIVVSSKIQSTYVEIVISDTGKGISPENLADLFDQKNAFTTLGTRQERGTGLGLLLCKDFMIRHSGTIRAESVEGKGTQIILHFPV